MKLRVAKSVWLARKCGNHGCGHRWGTTIRKAEVIIGKALKRGSRLWSQEQQNKQLKEEEGCPCCKEAADFLASMPDCDQVQETYPDDGPDCMDGVHVPGCRRYAEELNGIV